jgi:glucose-6-phosphate 1-epimerase
MDLAAIAEMDSRFRIPGVAKIDVGNGGLARVVITTSSCTGEMYLHGAHVTAWQRRGAEPVLFVSSESRWQDGHAIRGGVPICFPWFAAKADESSAPMHGFVRTKAWQLESILQTGDTVTVTMFTDSNDQTKQWWPADFSLIHRATFGSELRLELVVKNTGAAPLRFEEALHSYFRVGNIEKVQLHGLGGVTYLDKTDANRKKTQQGPISIVAETDRIYLNTAGAVELEDRALHRCIDVAKERSLTTVVWNPWIDKAKGLSDFGDAEWVQMVCIETCNVADFAIELGPGEQHQMAAIIRTTSLLQP